ncbi:MULTISPECIES: carbohydrate ABC transporter permease [Streptomyces]|jgi:N,N'-diacetylchitobiose transport system permease protein|uniref:Sugar binding-protein-dependent transporter n=2 Tax=Streptomyces griseoaurantiacus TaxID=68213 RepID=F3NMX8_9ACTN|nr:MULTISPECIES: carbohydrate ABC transporter permease [Streptomyces]EGG45164.1 sugar binding-protein-dependent transporter [Streptomyces griseoaurantiacus M045]MCF0088247.1 Trehalose transport system permease protein SugB [Streptomyces sp. MH192]MCF0101086.1 Trehalose transport system permease protein SugB [Streptomyces sp. MH191]MDX3091298.1 carbohydrate ABC transporter permease [Streptomyces sp. ME12-02E]MDX3334765.1 carbohydrate ABC transporter permease [Streptomyces sp. ME02-6978a]
MTTTAAPPRAADRPSTRPFVPARKRRAKAGWNVLGLLVFLVVGFPVYWMLNTAVKPAKDAIDPDPSLLPTGLTLSNFRRALDIADFWGPVGRSLVVSLTVVLIGIAVGMLAALAISRFAFRGRKVVIVAILAVQMIPLVAMIIPVFLLLNDLGQYDRLSGLILTYLTFILPFTVWTLRGFIVNIPRELEEAAMVDGCSRTGAFVRVVFPLLAPGLVATSVYGFIQAWNEYLYALMLMSQQKQTATVWLANFTTKHGTEYAPMMAGATMMAVPIVVLFLLVQRKMAAGLTAGAVKG